MAEDYTVAWICTLAVEKVAAIGMLGENHPYLLTRHTDANSYTFGRVGVHNVVIVSPPWAGLGQGTMARVATDTLKSFPFLKLVLSVGIGSGIPSQDHDVRLGDVVVGMPRQGSGGVVQYDLGNATSATQFSRLGVSSRPSRLLLSTVSKLRARHYTEEPGLSGYLAQMSIRNAELMATFARPEARHDMLFEPSYAHRMGEGDCSSCDVGKIVSRPERHTEGPVIHYGPIGSSNQMIKDAQLRDKLQRDYNILCFEMEAAEIPDNLQSLLIRGICDYSDSHKDRTWQAYAAGAAAAYAKELLVVMPPISTDTLVSREWMSNAFLDVSRKTIANYRVFSVPFKRNANFTSREALIKEIHASINWHHSVLLYGGGGVGKTELAVEYAYRIRGSYPESHVLWLCASTSERFLQGCQELYRKLHQTEEADFPLDISDSMFTWLRERTEKWLLVMDDIDLWILESPMQSTIFGLVQELSSSSSSNKSLIITTRNRGLGDTLHAKQQLHVSDPSIDEAMTLLRSLLRDPDGDPTFEFDAPYLLKDLQCSVLAISQAAAYMNETSVQVHQYLQALREARQDLGWSGGGGSASDLAPTAVRHTINIALRQLREFHPDAVALLSFLVMFDTDSFPAYLLQEPGKNEFDFSSAVEVLLGMSMLVRSPGGNSYIIHGLVRRYVHEFLIDADQEEYHAFLALEFLARRFPAYGRQSRDICESLLPLCQGILKRKFHTESSSLVRARLLFKIGYFERVEIGEVGNAARDKISEAHDTFLKILGEDDDLTIGSLKMLSTMAYERGEISDALKLYRKLLALQARRLGEDDPETLKIMAVFGFVLLAQNQLDESEALLLSVVSKYDEQLGSGQHLDALSARSNLALVYQGQGRYEEAESLFRRVVEGCEKTLGEEHADTLASTNNLVSVLVRQTKYREALQPALGVQEKCARLLAETHPDTLASMDNLASVLGEMGFYEEAEIVNEKALQLYEETAGKNSPARLTSLHRLGAVYQLQGKLAESEALFREELMIAEEKSGEGEGIDDVINSSRDRLVQVLEAQEKLLEAASLVEKACEVSTRLLGKDHPKTVEAREHYVRLMKKVTAESDHIAVDEESLLSDKLASVSTSDKGSPTGIV